jgi:hypothetical protein
MGFKGDIMANFIVPVKTIEEDVLDLPNSDRLSLVKIDGYICIQGKDSDGNHTLKKGDKVVYIPEAAVVPEWVLKKIGLWNEELEKGVLSGPNGNIVKAKRLRGTFSQGLIYPLNGDILETKNEKISVDVDMDVSKFLEIEKYEAPIPSSMSGNYCVLHDYNMKYDFENIQSRPTLFDEGEMVRVLEKAHGCADANTIIETIEYGKIKIKDLIDKEGCHVKAFDITSKEIIYEILEATSVLNDNDDWYEIELENGISIKLTGNHPIWLPDLECYRKVEDLIGNENVLID